MIQSRKGSELVEAAISLPILILSVMLMLRLFTFCLEILSAGIHEHLNALEAWDSYRGGGINRYSTEREIEMMRGGCNIRSLYCRCDQYIKAPYGNE